MSTDFDRTCFRDDEITLSIHSYPILDLFIQGGPTADPILAQLSFEDVSWLAEQLRIWLTDHTH